MAHQSAFAFLIHPLVWWQRFVLGFRRADIRMLINRPATLDAVGKVGTVTLHTNHGAIPATIMGVPSLPGTLLENQQLGLAMAARAAHLATEQHKVGVIGLGNALGVIAGRGTALAKTTTANVTTGHAATAWAATQITLMALEKRSNPDEPVGLFGIKGTVGHAVAQGLLAHGVSVVVSATGRTKAMAEALGCTVTSHADLLLSCSLLVGAATNGPVLAAQDIAQATTIVDLALPPTIGPGRTRHKVLTIPGETLYLSGKITASFWGRLWLLFANYGKGCVFACFAEPAAKTVFDLPDTIGQRRLSLETVNEYGRALTELGFSPHYESHTR